MAVGPSPAEIIFSLSKADQWAAEIQQNFRKELGKAYYENDTLMRSILESDKTRLVSACFSHGRNVRWREDWSYTNGQGKVCKGTIQETKYKYSISSRSRSETSPKDTLLTSGNSHLFLIKNWYRGETPLSLRL